MADAGVVDVRAWGAEGDGVTDDFDAIQAAIAAAEDAASSGRDVTVFFPGGVYRLASPGGEALSLTPDNAGTRGWLRFTGPNATIRLTNDVFTFLRFARTADGDSFSRIAVEDLTVDADASFRSSGQSSVIGFTTGATSRINISRIRVRDVRTLNVRDVNTALSGVDYTTGTVSAVNGTTTLVGTGTAWRANALVEQVVVIGSDPAQAYVVAAVIDDTHLVLDTAYTGPTVSRSAYALKRGAKNGGRMNLSLYVADSVADGDPYTITDVVVEDCAFDGGNYGVMVGGFCPTQPGLNLFIDRVVIRGLTHAHRTPATTFSYDDSVHVGSNGRVGRCLIENIYHEGSGDGGIEVNQAEDCVIRNCTMVNCYYVGIYLGNYNTYRDAFTAPKILVDGVKVIRESSAYSTTEAGTFGRGVTLFDTAAGLGGLDIPLGDVTIRDLTFDWRIDNLPQAQGGAVTTSGRVSMASLSLTDISVRYLDWDFTATNGTRFLTAVDVRHGHRYPVRLRNLVYEVDGRRQAGASSVHCPAVLWGGTDPLWDIDGVHYHVTVAGSAGGTSGGHYLLDNATTATGARMAVRNVTFVQSGDPNSRGIIVRPEHDTSVPQQWDRPLIVRDCDFATVASGQEILFTAATAQRHQVIGSNLPRPVFPTLAAVASAAQLQLPATSDRISVTGTTTITSILAGYPGRQVTLLFDSALTVTDGQNLALAGNLVTARNTVLELASRRTGTYTAGTVAVATNSKTVTGTGTQWIGNLAAGQVIEINGIEYTIASVDTNTQLTLNNAYTGATIAGGGTYVGHQYLWTQVSRSVN